MNKIAVALSLLLLAACTPEEKDALPFQPVTDMHDTMAFIIDPAAQVIWRSAGSEITIDGEQSLAPTTDEGWQEVIRNAAIVAEAGNLLMMTERPSRIRDFGDDWYEYAQGVADRGKMALEAAKAHDDKALFDIGGQLYRICTSCHQKYMRVGY